MSIDKAVEVISATFSKMSQPTRSRILTRTVFLEENVCPHLSDKPIVEKGYIYNLSFFCVYMWSMGAIFQNLNPSVTLKMGSRSPKSNGVKVTKI